MVASRDPAERLSNPCLDFIAWDETGFPSLHSFDAPSDLRFPVRTEVVLSGLEAFVQRSNQRRPLLLGQGERVFEDFLSRRGHPNSLRRGLSDRQRALGRQKGCYADKQG